MGVLSILFEWKWCSGPNSIQPTLHLVKQVLNIIRIVIPMILIIMTSIDIAKKVINPDDKDGQKKIMTRAIAALIVFLIPSIVKLSLRVIEWGGAKTDVDYSLSQCWEDA